MFQTPIQALRKDHPCFFAESRGRYGRIHLPVAASCSIQCAYCRRDYACVHENRPGVTDGVINPEEALERLEQALIRMPNISVAGIAGPGDAFCNADSTMRTFELIRRKHRDIALCVSSNGLNVKKYIPTLRDLHVGFVTITVNAIDPGIGARLYKSVRWEGEILRGRVAAQTLIDKQMEAISLLKSGNFTVKVNSVVIPGVNDDHMLFLARKMARLGVDLMNFLPLIPIAGTDMQDMAPPSPAEMKKLREKAGEYVPQMHHCTRCRSDAVGLLHHDIRQEGPKPFMGCKSCP
jgi:nitrogen fixation protein NifB